MKRRDFITTAAAATVCGALPVTAAQSAKANTTLQSTTATVLPERIVGVTLPELRQDDHDLLYKRYLPFWEKGGYDHEHGGVMCELKDDGSVAVDMKYIWYQGRAVWIYSYLYNNFGKDPRWLAMAGKIRDFMVKHMHVGVGETSGPSRRRDNQTLFDTTKDRIRRLLEMCWDDVFDGWADEDFYVFGDDKYRRGPSYDLKTMWAHCEILIACMTVLEYTGEDWAKMWYERARSYLIKNMANTPSGIWRQAVDRRGKDVKRPGISVNRKGNFHQPRVLMTDMLSLDRMIANKGRLTPFPS